MPCASSGSPGRSTRVERRQRSRLRDLRCSAPAGSARAAPQLARRRGGPVLGAGDGEPERGRAARGHDQRRSSAGRRRPCRRRCRRSAGGLRALVRRGGQITGGLLRSAEARRRSRRRAGCGRPPPPSRAGRQRRRPCSRKTRSAVERRVSGRLNVRLMGWSRPTGRRCISSEWASTVELDVARPRRSRSVRPISAARGAVGHELRPPDRSPVGAGKSISHVAEAAAEARRRADPRAVDARTRARRAA